MLCNLLSLGHVDFKTHPCCTLRFSFKFPGPINCPPVTVTWKWRSILPKDLKSFLVWWGGKPLAGRELSAISNLKAGWGYLSSVSRSSEVKASGLGWSNLCWLGEGWGVAFKYNYAQRMCYWRCHGSLPARSRHAGVDGCAPLRWAKQNQSRQTSLPHLSDTRIKTRVSVLPL